MIDVMIFSYFLTLYLASIVTTLKSYIKDNKVLNFTYIFSIVSAVIVMITLLSHISEINTVLVLIAWSVYTVLRSLTLKGLNSHFKTKVFKEFVDEKFPEQVSDFEHKVFLLNNGVVANKYALSSTIKELEIYSNFAEVMDNVGANLTTLYENREDVGYPIFSWLSTTLNEGAKVADSLTTRLLFEKNESVVVNDFTGFAVQLLYLNSVVNGVLEKSLLKIDEKEEEVCLSSIKES